MFAFRYENDFFHATDEYFTQGVQLMYAAPGLGRSLVAHILIRPRGSVVRHALLLEQQCYTPTSIRRDTIFTGDRPFAAALFLSEQAVAVEASRGLRITSALSLGVLGPCAVCAEEQRGIHDALDNIEPLGWEFQVSTGVILNYAATAEKRVLSMPFLEGSLGAAAEAGTYRTNLDVLGAVEVGRFHFPFRATPCARPALPDERLRGGERQARRP